MKKYTLAAGSARLALTASYRNIGERPIRYSISHLFRLAVGGSAGREDFVEYSEGGAPIKKGFGDSERSIGPAPSWLKVTDTERRESLLIDSASPAVARRTLQSSQQYTQVEYQTRRYLAQPGETLIVNWDLVLVKDASMLTESPPT